MADDLDMRDLGEVLRRGVLPVTGALFRPGELTGIDVYLVGRPEDFEPPYGAEVHVRVTDIELNVWTCKAGVYTAELQSAEDLADRLALSIENDISESGYAWGEQRTLHRPGARPTELGGHRHGCLARGLDTPHKNYKRAYVPIPRDRQQAH